MVGEPLPLIGVNEPVATACAGGFGDGRRDARHRRRQGARRDHAHRPASPSTPTFLPHPGIERPTTCTTTTPLRHPRHPRRAGVRPHHRRGHPADPCPPPTCRTASAVSAAATSTRARGNPTRTALEDAARCARGRHPRPVVRVGPRCRGRAAAHRARPGDHVVIGNDVYGGTHRLIRRIFGDWGVRHHRRHERPRRRARGDRARHHEGAVGRDAVEPADEDLGYRRARRARRRGRRARRRRQHLRDPACSSRSRSAPTWSCTRPRSTSAGTPTSSAARSCSRRGRRSWPSASASRSSPRGRSRARSTRSSRRAASRRSASGWSGTAGTRSRSPRRSTSTPRSRACSTPGSSRTPGTSSRRGR